MKAKDHQSASHLFLAFYPLEGLSDYHSAAELLVRLYPLSIILTVFNNPEKCYLQYSERLIEFILKQVYVSWAPSILRKLGMWKKVEN